MIMTLECILQYLIGTGLHPHGALLVNLPGHRADLKMLSAHIYKHSDSCNYVSLITDKLSTTTLYLELQYEIKWTFRDSEALQSHLNDKVKEATAQKGREGLISALEAFSSLMYQDSFSPLMY